MDQKHGVCEVKFDASPNSTFTHDILGGTPTIVGAWDTTILLAKSGGMGPPTSPGMVRRGLPLLPLPLLLVRVDGLHIHDFTMQDYAHWLQE